MENNKQLLNTIEHRKIHQKPLSLNWKKVHNNKLNSKNDKNV